MKQDPIRDFLKRLTDPKKTPKVPLIFRIEAHYLLFNMIVGSRNDFIQETARNSKKPRSK